VSRKIWLCSRLCASLLFSSVPCTLLPAFTRATFLQSYIPCHQELLDKGASSLRSNFRCASAGDLRDSQEGPVSSAPRIQEAS